jgi:hypothetical protein
VPKVLYPQPFPFNHYDTEVYDLAPCGNTTGRYVQGTASQMMNLYWKCKSFSVSGSYINYPFNDPNQPPNNTSWTGNITSSVADETYLVCGITIENDVVNFHYMTQNITVSGQINSAFYGYGDFRFTGSDFYFNSDPNQEIVKLYGNFSFDTDQDDTGGITTNVGGSLAPFLINGFQVYEGGLPVNFDAVGLIEDFSASFTAADLWPYEP